jgi:porin
VFCSEITRRLARSAWLRIAAAALVVALTAPAGAAGAQESDGTQQTVAGTIGAAATDWQKLRDRWFDRGFDVHATYTGAVFWTLSGGVQRGASYLDNIDLQLTLDGERLVGWPGATLFLYGLGTHGDNPSRDAGDAQGVSNIAAPQDWKLYECWIQQNLVANRLSLLVGRYDLNTEFYVLHAAGLFLNSSFGIGPEFSMSGHGGPSIYSDTAVGARLTVKPIQGFQVQAALLDGVPVNRPGGVRAIFHAGDGLLLVGEIDYLSGQGAGAGTGPGASSRQSSQRFRIGRTDNPLAPAGKIGLGGWYYTSHFQDLSAVQSNGDPVVRHGSGGVYLVGAQVIYRDEDVPDRRLTLFVQSGLGDGRVDRFVGYTGGGLTMSAPLPGRDDDEAGLAVAAAYNGSHYVDQQHNAGAPVGQTEVAVELTYLAQLTSWLALQPDLQYVINPNTDPRLNNSLVAAVELQLAL